MGKLSGGFSLIEILVSIFLIALLLLGLDALQLSAIKLAQDNYYHSLANYQLFNISQALSVGDSSYIDQWEKATKELLPQAKISILSSSSAYRINLCWKIKNCIYREVSHYLKY